MITDYRRIYEQYHGPIPKDKNGRTYEIHHIDGNRNNNNLNNLKAVSIKEHYDIHYSQGDWGACLLITRAMKILPEEKSRLGQLENQKRIIEGRHIFVNSNPVYNQIKDGKNIFVSTDINGQLLEKGKHSSQNLKSRAKNKKTHLQRVAEGKNHLVGGAMQRALVKKGIHPLQKRADGTSASLDRVVAGTHNLLGSNLQRKRVENGTHPSKTKVCCLSCQDTFSLNTFGRHSNKCN